MRSEVTVPWAACGHHGSGVMPVFSYVQVVMATLWCCCCMLHVGTLDRLSEEFSAVVIHQDSSADNPKSTPARLGRGNQTKSPRGACKFNPIHCQMHLLSGVLSGGAQWRWCSGGGAVEDMTTTHTRGYDHCTH